MRQSRLTRKTPWPPTAEQVQRWRDTQDEARRRQQAKPRSRRDTGPSRKTRDSLVERSGGQCEYPACPYPADHDHHRQGRKAGGTRRARINHLSNQVHLCWRHHEQVGRNPAWAEQRGLIVREPTDPATVPVLLRHGLILLDDEGTYTTIKGAAA